MEDWRESSKVTQQSYLNIKKLNTDLNYNLFDFESKKQNYWNPIFTDFLKKQELEEYPVYMKDKISKIKKINNQLIPKNNKLLLGKITKITEWLFIKAYNLSRKTNRILHPLVNFTFSNYLESISVDFINHEEKYIYFPLHYQPECTTSPLGDVFEDQLIAIEWILNSKPKDVILYIREHPAQNFDANTIRYKSLEIYQKIASMHHVKFISRNISTFELIRKSYAVATITGTVGLEAIYREKPVLMFGYHVHQYAPGVFPIRTLDDCGLAMEKIFKEGFKPSKRDVFFFLAALQETSVPVNYFAEEEMNDIKKINQFSDFLYTFIKKSEICNSNSS
ncbi:capsular polysaccharide export protein, LipB/KpsS family [Thermosynechococcus sp. FA-CM-4201]